MRVMRAKLKLSDLSAREGQQILVFRAVALKEPYPKDGFDENNSFALWTPSAELTMTVTNPNLFNKLLPGQEFYVDFTTAGGGDA